MAHENWRNAALAMKKLLTKKALATALALESTRTVDTLVRKRIIPVYVLGHRTRFFDLDRVLAALEKFEVKAIGQK